MSIQPVLADVSNLLQTLQAGLVSTILNAAYLRVHRHLTELFYSGALVSVFVVELRWMVNNRAILTSMDSFVWNRTLSQLVLFLLIVVGKIGGLSTALRVLDHAASIILF